MLRARPGRITGTQDTQTGARVVSDALFGSPAYLAGLDRDDIIVSVAGSRTATSADVKKAIAMRKPGDSMQVVYDRRGERITTSSSSVTTPASSSCPPKKRARR